MFKNKKLSVSLLVATAVFFYFGAVQAVQTVPTTDVNANTNTSIATEEETTTTDTETTTETTEEVLITPAETETTGYLTEYAETYYGGSDSLSVTGHFLNDVVVAGNNITIDGVVEGDVITAGANVTIKAEVMGNVRAAGGNVYVQGTVHKNVTLAGGQVQINTNAQLDKDLIIFAGTADIFGPVGGDIKIYAGQVNLDNTIGGDAELGEGVITMGENAEIMGNLSYTATAEEALDVDSKVQGQIKRTEPVATPTSTKEEKGSMSKYLTGGFWLWNLMKMLGLLLVGLIVSSVFKGTTASTVNKMYANPVRGLLVGLAVFLFAPLLAVLAMLTIIGMPLGAIALASYFILLYVSMVFVGAAIGKKIMPNSASLVGPTFIGLIIVYAIKMIPFVGSFILLIGILWALGSLMKKGCCCGCCDDKPKEKVKTPEPEIALSLKPKTFVKKTTAKKVRTLKNSRIKK
ncbi:MAG: polymer-forming cytoskeletal protein [Patescibacteria group bacterium]|jgi:cytoskeletal protein CcmA (bactofilin family)